MTVPNTPLETPRAGDSSLVRDILAASKYGIYRLRARLGTRGLVVLGAAAIAAGLALNWSWLVAIGAAPLLLTALPCVAMCALGICMMPKGERSHEDHRGAEDAHPENSAPPAKDRAGE